jgi:hypothetical protein
VEPAVNLLPPELKRESTISPVSAVSRPVQISEPVEQDYELPLMISEPAEVKADYSNNMFICNAPLTTTVKETLTEFTGIRSYDRDLFTNRSCAELYQNFNVQNIWLNLKDKYARAWISKNLMENSTYTVVVGYTGSKHQKFIKDLDDTKKVRAICKISELNDLKSLSMDDLINQLSNGVKIHAPANLLAGCLGLSKVITKNQKNY